jgi:conjugal transfer pilus assembly protein TraF
MIFKFLSPVFAVFALFPQLSSAGSSWWTSDVWQAEDRPFLFYGEAKKESETVKKTNPKAEEKNVYDKNDFSRFKTIEELRQERKNRLDAAIMNPTKENMMAYQAINAHMIRLSARFSESWQLGRLANPEFDFTSTHPSANFATVAMREAEKQKRSEQLKSLRGDAGLIFFGKPGEESTELALAPLRSFAENWGLEVLAIASGTTFEEPRPGSAVTGFSGVEKVYPDNGISKKLGISMFPAVVLIPKPDALKRRPDFRLLSGGLSGCNGILVATGIHSGEELARRITFVLNQGNFQRGLKEHKQ